MALAELVPIFPAHHEFPPSMQELGERQRRFVWAYMFNGGEGAAAARAAGYSDSSDACKVRAHTLIHDDRILRALRDMCTKYLFSLAPKAIFRLGALLDEPKNPHHVKAIAMVLARTGYPEHTQVEHHHSGSIELNHTDATLEALAYLKSMDVPRKKLEAQFGHSGLARYERMLEERDAKRGLKMIEGEVTK